MDGADWNRRLTIRGDGVVLIKQRLYEPAAVRYARRLRVSVVSALRGRRPTLRIKAKPLQAAQVTSTFWRAARRQRSEQDAPDQKPRRFRYVRRLDLRRSRKIRNRPRQLRQPVRRAVENVPDLNGLLVTTQAPRSRTRTT
jgi:hypothetical protein